MIGVSIGNGEAWVQRRTRLSMRTPHSARSVIYQSWDDLADRLTDLLRRSWWNPLPHTVVLTASTHLLSLRVVRSLPATGLKRADRQHIVEKDVGRFVTLQETETILAVTVEPGSQHVLVLIGDIGFVETLRRAANRSAACLVLIPPQSTLLDDLTTGNGEFCENGVCISVVSGSLLSSVRTFLAPSCDKSGIPDVSHEALARRNSLHRGTPRVCRVLRPHRDFRAIKLLVAMILAILLTLAGSAVGSKRTAERLNTHIESLRSDYAQALNLQTEHDRKVAEYTSLLRFADSHVSAVETIEHLVRSLPAHAQINRLIVTDSMVQLDLLTSKASEPAEALASMWPATDPSILNVAPASADNAYDVKMQVRRMFGAQ